MPRPHPTHRSRLTPSPQCSPRMLPARRTLLAECKDPARLSTLEAQGPGSALPPTPTPSRGGASPQRPGTAIFRAVGDGRRRECLFDSAKKIQHLSSQALMSGRTDTFVSLSSLPHLTHGRMQPLSGKLGQRLLLGRHLCKPAKLKRLLPRPT